MDLSPRFKQLLLLACLRFLPGMAWHGLIAHEGGPIKKIEMLSFLRLNIPISGAFFSFIQKLFYFCE